MTDSITKHLPEGYTLDRRYDPPGMVIPLLQFSIFLVFGIGATRLVREPPTVSSILGPLILLIALTFLSHELIHAGTEFLLGYRPRFEAFPPHSLGPTTPASRNEMLVVLLMPLISLSIVFTFLYFMNVLPPILLLPGFIFNLMFAVADIWAAGVLIRMPPQTLVLIDSDASSESPVAWLLVPDH